MHMQLFVFSGIILATLAAACYILHHFTLAILRAVMSVPKALPSRHCRSSSVLLQSSCHHPVVKLYMSHAGVAHR